MAERDKWPSARANIHLPRWNPDEYALVLFDVDDVPPLLRDSEIAGAISFNEERML